MEQKCRWSEAGEVRTEAGSGEGVVTVLGSEMRREDRVKVIKSERLGESHIRFVIYQLT